MSQVPGLHRQRIALAATFTVDPVRDPVEFWLRFLRVPASVELVGYGQLVAHLLAGPPADAHSVPVALGGLAAPADGNAGALDAAMDDLVAAVAAYRRRTDAPLLLVVCPASPGVDRRPADGRLDDRLTALAARTPGVHAVWAADYADTYPVSEVSDERADVLGHVPYTGEYFATLGTILVRELRRAAGQPRRQVLVDGDRLPVDRLTGALPGHEVRACPPDALTAALAAADPATTVVLDTDPETVAALQRDHPGLLALAVPAGWDDVRRFLAHVWPLDPPSPRTDAGLAAPDPRASAGLAAPIGPERAAYLSRS